MGDSQSGGLYRAMGRWTLAALVINSIIGSGIFGLPSVAAGLLGSKSPLAYLIAAVGMGFVIACFAEIASQFGESGGPYLYAREAFGRITGIQVGVFLVAVKISVAAAAADLFVDYLVEIWPMAGRPLPRLAVLTVLIGLLAAVNVRGVKSGAAANNALTVAKLVPLILFAVVGSVFIFTKHPAVAAVTSAPSTSQLGARVWLQGVLIVTYAYSGFEGAVVPMAEAKEPRRDAPFALFAALAAVTLVYSTVQYVVVGLLPDAASTTRPLAAAARIFWGGPGAVLMSAGAMISVYGYLTAMLLHSPRALFALGENWDFPRVFARVHPKFRTPHVAILTFAALMWCLAAGGSFRWNVYLSSATRLVVFGFTCAALPVLRRKNPRVRAFRVPGGLIVSTAAVAFTIALAVETSPAEQIILVFAVAISIGAWLWGRRGVGATPEARGSTYIDA
jgi:basic amino acid/polyamine antiporter, APA family